MATFNVFVVGPLDDTPDGLARLADAMSQRYGLPASDLTARLQRGRFRVKSHVDHATAEKYREDLAAIGALVQLEDAEISPTATPPAGTPRVAALSLAPTTQRATPPVGLPRATSTSKPPVSLLQEAAAASGRATTSPPPSARAASSSLPPANAERPAAPQFASGLAAAFSQEMPDADLGALGGDAGMSLESLDGVQEPDSGAPCDVDFDEDGEDGNLQLPAAAPAPAKAAAAKPRTRAEPLDLFAPPDAEEASAKVDLHTDEVVEQDRRRASMPPETAPVAPASASSSPSLTRPPATAADPTPPSTRAQPALPRTHVIAGAAFAVLGAFVPVHFVAAMRERSAFAEIDAKVTATQKQADSEEMYAALDGYRATQLENKESAAQMIALTSLLLWAVLAAALAYLWFRRIPWDRVLKPRG